MWTALVLCLSPAPCPAVDEAEWLARLRPPKLVHVDFTVHWQARANGTDFEFAEDPEQRLADAQERIEAGERGARVLLQASSALYRLRRLEDIKRVLPACLAAYDRELADDPDDVLLAVGRARALTMVGTLSGDDAAFQDALAQLDAARARVPGDPRLAIDSLLVWLARVANGQRRGAAEPGWLDAAEQDARRAIELAPADASARFALFQVRHTRGVTSGDRDALLGELRAGALELLAAAEVVPATDAGTLRLAGQGFLFMAGALPRFVEVADGGAVRPPDEPLRAALEAFGAGLADLPRDDELAREVLRVYWLLDCVLGELEEHAQRLAAVVHAGLPRELALALATTALYIRGATDEARAAALALAELASDDIGHGAVAAYFIKTGELALALEHVDALSGTSGAHLGARAFLLLRLGKTEEALETCAKAEELGDVEGELAGDLAYVRGVALALLGRHAEARAALERAARILTTDEGLAETLAEVRARK
jgi:tetratricopeptide (TPR) repeat protein